MADTQANTLFTGSSAKCQCKASCSESIKNFKTVTESIHTSAGPLCDYTDHIPTVIGKKTLTPIRSVPFHFNLCVLLPRSLVLVALLL